MPLLLLTQEQIFFNTYPMLELQQVPVHSSFSPKVDARA